MAITVSHTYNTTVDIIYRAEESPCVSCRDTGTMDDIAERVIDFLVKHKFSHADVCSAYTGEVLMIIERT